MTAITGVPKCTQVAKVYHGDLDGRERRWTHSEEREASADVCQADIGVYTVFGFEAYLGGELQGYVGNIEYR